MRSAAHSDGYNSLVVKSLYTGGVVGDRLENRVDDLLRGAGRVFSNNLLKSTASKQIALAVACVEHAVAEEDEQIARFHAEFQFVVLCLVKQPQGQSRGLDYFGPSYVNIDGAREARVRDRQRAVCIIPDGVDDR